MKRILSGGVHHLQSPFPTVIAALLVFWASLATFADQVQMRNGDQYFGNVLSLNKDTLVIQSDVLGNIRLPRDKVAFVNLGANPVAPSPALSASSNKIARLPALSVTNRPADFSATLQQLGGTSNVLQQIESQYLSEATPEAKAKYNELLSGFLSGKMSITDIRAQAQTTADQARSMRKDIGDDAGALIDSYLAILDAFIKETEPPPSSSTNRAPPRAVKSKSTLAEEE